MSWSRAALVAIASAGLALAGTLSDAVQSGDQEQVRHLLKTHADVNLPDADGTTPLEWAVYNDDLATAQMIAARGRQPEHCKPGWRNTAIARRHQSQCGDG